MNAITAPALSSLSAENRAMLQMIRRGPFKDCNDQEFDEAITVARSLGLDPIRREIYAFVFNAKSQTRRNMVLVTSIMGYRKIAARHGNYRPGPCRLIIDREAINPKTNPRGIVAAEATVFVHSHGEWHPIIEEVSWESYAPIVTKVWSRDLESLVDLKPEDWHLDPKKEAWIRQPDVMLKKCFDDQTEVLTTKGFQKFSELSAPVMQVTPNGLQPVGVRAFRQPYRGDMVTLASGKLDFRVTPNHDMVTTAGKIEAGDLYERARTRATFLIPRHAPGNPEEAEITDQAIMAAAAYIADGYDRAAAQFTISVSRPRKVAKLEEIGGFAARSTRAATGSVAHTATRDIVSTMDKVAFTYDRALIADLVGPEKSINIDGLLSLSQRQARLFIETWIFFDGTTSGTRRGIYTSRLDHVEAIELAACLAGQTVAPRRSRTNDISDRPNYFLQISDINAVRVVRWGREHHNNQGNPSSRTGLTLTPYDGDVWCVTVPSGQIVVRREGFSFVCGNCAEAQALRRGWPTDLSRLYVDEELDRSKLIDAEAIDVTPSEVVAEAERQRRLDALGGPSITVDPMDGSNGLIGVPAGKMADWVMDRLKRIPAEKVAEFQDRNRRGLQELWVHNKSDALAVKKEIEARIAAAPKAKPAEEAKTQPEIGEAITEDATPEKEVTW